MSEEAARAGASFQQDGFVIVRSFLNGNELAEIDAQLDRYILEVVPRSRKEDVVYEDPSKSAIRHLSGLHKYDDFWKTALMRAKTLALVEACVGSAVEPSHSELFFKAAYVGTAAPIHQDNAYMHYKPADGAAVWVALDEVTFGERLYPLRQGLSYTRRPSSRARRCPAIQQTAGNRSRSGRLSRSARCHQSR